MRAYDRLEPFGPREEHRRFCHVVSTILNIMPRKDKKVYRPENFMLDYSELTQELLKTEKEENPKRGISREMLKGLAKGLNASLQKGRGKLSGNKGGLPPRIPMKK